MDLPDPVEAVRLRVDRAGEHIAELHLELERVTAGHKFKYVYIAPSGESEIVPLDDDPPVLSPKVSLLVGETVYNLRAALDYLVYKVACIGNNNRHVSGTQFPIEDTEDGFESRVTGRTKVGKARPQFLRCVPGGAIKLIRELQPFAGCEWTRTLRDLSNPDKHRQLIEVFYEGTAEAKLSESSATIIGGGGEAFVDAPVDVHIRLFFYEGRQPVIETLELLQAEVGTVVDVFRSRIHTVPIDPNRS